MRYRQRRIVENILPASINPAERHILFPSLPGTVEPDPTKTYVDIGASLSELPWYLRSLGATVFAFDIGYQNLSKLQERMALTAKKMGVPQIVAQNAIAFWNEKRAEHPGQYIAACATNLPLASESADFVYSIASIVHGLDQDDELFDLSIAEALRILRPGGELQLAPIFNGMSSRQKRNHRKVLTMEDATVEPTGFRNYSRIRVIKPAKT